MRPPTVHCLDHRLLDARIAVEAEETVGSEVGQLMSADHHPAMVVHLVNNQILQVDLAAMVEEHQGQASQAVAFQPVDQVFNGFGRRSSPRPGRTLK